MQPKTAFEEFFSVSNCQCSLLSNKIHLSGFFAYPDISPPQLTRISGVLLYRDAQKTVWVTYKHVFVRRLCFIALLAFTLIFWVKQTCPLRNHQISRQTFWFRSSVTTGKCSNRTSKHTSNSSPSVLLGSFTRIFHSIRVCLHITGRVS